MGDLSISRRGLLRVGALAGLSSVLLPRLAFDEALAQNVICNAQRPTTPAGALTALVQGNARWASEGQLHPGEDSERRTCVADNRQTPFAAILSCSDSRVPPELVFDQGLGDLFVARVAGNTATGKLLESLLYGQNDLGALVLFVLGHSDCGAVSTAVRSYPKHKLQFVKLIFPAVKEARAIVRRNGGDPKDPTQVIPVATDLNVLFVVDKLRKFFKVPISEGTFSVAGGRYDLDNQQVTILTQ